MTAIAAFTVYVNVGIDTAKASATADFELEGSIEARCQNCGATEIVSFK